MGINPPSHSRTVDTSDIWITPRLLIDRLGPFDLDPCAAVNQPWPCAATSFNENDNGLLKPWRGFVYCNPPYGRKCEAWLDRMALHGDGIALVFARTDTKMFFKHVWPKASAVLFVRGRITFHYEDGSAPRNGNNSGGPSVFVAYGARAAERLELAKDLGKLIQL